jgi:hypothetical protein
VTFVEVADVANACSHYLDTVKFTGDGGNGWHDSDDGNGCQLVGRLGGVLLVEPKKFVCLSDGVENTASEDGWADWMRLIPEGSYDTEVSASSSETPHQIWVCLIIGADELAVSGDHVHADQVVAGKAILSHQPTQTTSEGETGDPCFADGSGGDRKTKRLGCTVEVSEQSASVGPGRCVLSINTDGGHLGKVDHQTAIAHRVPAHAMTPSTHRDDKGMTLGETNSFNHISHKLAAGDERRPPIDHAIPHRPNLVVISVLWPDQITTKNRIEL